MTFNTRTIARASRALLGILLLGALLPLASASARTWPKPQGYVNDFAGLIDPASRDSIEAIAREVREKTGAELAVVTTPDLGEDDIERVAVELFESWGIGKKGSDEGVLILLASKERRVRIEVGYGLEGILPDGLCGSIIRRGMTPELARGNYGAGLLRGARLVAGVIAKDRGVTITGASPLPVDEEEQGNHMAAFLAALVVVLIVSSLARRSSYRRGWMWPGGGWGGRGGPGGYGGMFGGFGGMGGWGGGGGGGGFGGFGGGRSGGGGASGGF